MCSKLIGARYFNNGYAKVIGVPLNDTHKTPRDANGHGTHTLATAGGRPCAAPRRSASAAARRGRVAAGARGGVPRLLPPFNGSDACYDSDILAAFEAAIADGVHVISASVGADPNDYLEDAIAIGALHAVKAGITVVCSASNFGPDPGTVTNVAPWILTVAASTMDRAFPAHLVFNRNRVEGQSLSPTWLRGKTFYTMISAANAAVPGYPPADA